MPRKVETATRTALNPLTGQFNVVTTVDDKNNTPTITRTDVTKLSVTKSKITRIDYDSGDYKTFTYLDNFTIDEITENVDGIAIIYKLNYDGNGNVTSKTITP